MTIMLHTCYKYFGFFSMIRIFFLLNRISFCIFQQILIMLSQQGAFLFSPVHHHDEHSFVSNYLRARVLLVVCFASIVLS